MPSWAGNVGWIFAVGVFALIVGLIVFRFLGGPDTRRWKCAEIAILTLGAVGLFPLILNAQTEIARWQLDSSQSRMEFTGQFLVNSASDKASFSCQRRERSGFEPKNYDQIVEEQKAFCLWITKAKKQLEALDFKNAPTLSHIDIKTIPVSSLDSIKLDAERFKSSFESYITAQEKYVEVRDSSTVDPKRTIVFAVLAPFLLVAAFFLSVAKIIMKP